MLEFDIIYKKGENMIFSWNPAFALFKSQARQTLIAINETKKFETEHKANRERQQKQYDLIMQQRKKYESTDRS